MIVMITKDDFFKNIWENDNEALFSSRYKKQLFVFEDRYLNRLPQKALGIYKGSLSHKMISLLEVRGICRKAPDKGEFDISLYFRFLKKIPLSSKEFLEYFEDQTKQLLCEIPHTTIETVLPDI